MPSLTLEDQVLLHVSTSKQENLSALAGSASRHPLPFNEMLNRVVTDRLALAGLHLRVGDLMLDAGQYRTSISRHYYAMYHAGRAIVFLDISGDDHEKHAVLPRHLPTDLPNTEAWQIELNEARLTRNMADYDLYPILASAWHDDATNLSVKAAQFIADCQALYEHRTGAS